MDFIFDLDGTLADCSHRLAYIRSKPKNWKAFMADESIAADAPLWPMIYTLRGIVVTGEHNVIFCTGRHESCRDATLAWLSAHASIHDDPQSWGRENTNNLYMRPNEDYRPDYVMKEELYKQMLKDGYKPVMVFDDRTEVCDMWHRRGLLVAKIGNSEGY